MLVIKNISFSILGYTVQSYGTFVVLGLLSFVASFYWLSASRLKMAAEEMLSLAIWCTLSAAVGGRVAYLLECDDLPYYSWVDWCDVWGGGLSVLGSLVSVPLVLAVWAWAYKIDILALFDEVSLSVPLADFFGRFGCLFGGCCYGGFSRFMSVVYQDYSAAAPYNIPLFPVQLVTSLLFLAVFCVFLFIRLRFDANRRVPSGFFTTAYFLSAAFIRFGIDFFRGDRGVLVSYIGSTGITAYQSGCLVLGVLASIALVGVLLKKYRNTEAL